MNRIYRFLIVVAGFWALPVVSFAQIWVTELSVQQPDTVAQRYYDPEIHLYDANNDQLLGCVRVSGCSHHYGAFYTARDAFGKLDSTNLLFGEIAGRTIYLTVLDNRDTLICAEAMIPPAIVLGTSQNFNGSELETTIVKQFGSVAHLRVGQSLERTPQPNSPLVELREIEVRNESDGIGRLEIEAHIYEAGTDIFLGCSGSINGLEHVDFNNNLYLVHATFRRPYVGPELTYQDIADKNIYIEILEDDVNPCPCPEDIGVDQDDHVGTTEPFVGSELAEAKVIKNFGKVVHLALGLKGQPDRVVLSAPADFAFVQDSEIAFSWLSQGTGNESYQFQLAGDSLMANPVVNTEVAQTHLDVSGAGLNAGFYWWRVRAGNDFGWGLFSDVRNFAYSPAPTSVAATPGVPEHFYLEQNYPNPFNPTTTISYGLPRASDVSLTIYNSLGQEVRTLVDTRQESGVQAVVWDGRDGFGNGVPSGAYFYRLVAAGEFVQSQRMLLVK